MWRSWFSVLVGLDRESTVRASGVTTTGAGPSGRLPPVLNHARRPGLWGASATPQTMTTRATRRQVRRVPPPGWHPIRVWGVQTAVQGRRRWSPSAERRTKRWSFRVGADQGSARQRLTAPDRNEPPRYAQAYATKTPGFRMVRQRATGRTNFIQTLKIGNIQVSMQMVTGVLRTDL